MSTGIAAAGMAWKRADVPIPLPVQALDHATGYLMAAVAVRALARRAASGPAAVGRLSLARTARLLAELGPQQEGAPLAAEGQDDYAAAVEATAWGPARRLRPPITLAGAPLRWDLPAGKLGSAEPSWR
jgi:crotonobetainyl-CoA:carnitine CoA-transferase CaiB-like acyl-CoA transferase